MKNIFIIIAIVFVQNMQAQDEGVKKSIQTFFEGLHTADTLKMKQVCHDTMLLQSISEKNGRSKLTTENSKEFYKSIASIPAEMKVEERLLDFKIQIDGAMAHAWTPYEFYVNGKLSHKGVNSFQLFKDGEIWKIIYIVDTRNAPNP